ncbi:MAG TPA: hypothetical protein VEU97_05895, partial [Ktedonobacteraceae bacterium]|nr:hypothetical protein [Ktedonobacteraceae bacterium]
MGGTTTISDPTTGNRCYVGRDGAVTEGERPIIVDASSTEGSRVVREGAVDEGECPIIVDA